MGKKILLADDSITIQKVIELTFSDEDFDVVTVGNGRLAIEKVQDVRPDVVLCDIIMPEKDGYEVCDFVKKHPSLSHIPVLLLTGAFEPFDQERATRVGCDGFLAKPFEPQALIAKVKDLLRQAESRQLAAPAPPPPAGHEAEPQRSPEATVWAAPSPVATSTPWEAPQTRPAWIPPPSAEPSGVHFIPEDPFADEPSAPYEAPSGDTIRVPKFPRGEELERVPEVEPEPYVLEAPAAHADELLPMSGEEEESLAEPISWEEPRPVEPPPPVAAAPTERDLFLEEVFEESIAEPPAPPAPPPAASAPAAQPEPEPAAEELFQPEPYREPEPSRPAAAVLDFAAVVRDAGLGSPAVVEPEPEPELEPEEPEEPEEELAPVSPPSAAAPPVPEALAAVAEPVPVVEPGPVAEPALAAAELQMEDESFAEVAPPPAPAAEPAPSEAGAVTVPMDMVSQIAQRVVAQISEKVIREIAWEVIPDMAEALIKREIERLTAELHRS